jgi:hypothetical protein
MGGTASRASRPFARLLRSCNGTVTHARADQVAFAGVRGRLPARAGEPSGIRRLALEVHAGRLVAGDDDVVRRVPPARGFLEVGSERGSMTGVEGDRVGRGAQVLVRCAVGEPPVTNVLALLAAIADQLHDEAELEFAEQRLDRAHDPGLGRRYRSGRRSRVDARGSGGRSRPPRRRGEAHGDSRPQPPTMRTIRARRAGRPKGRPVRRVRAGPSRLYAAFSTGTSGIACAPCAIAMAGRRHSSSK